MRRSRIALVALMALTCFVAAGYGAARTTAGAKDSAPSGKGQSSCQLGTAGNKIKHVIYIQFDNTHFRRDNANVAVRPGADAPLAQLPQEQRHDLHQRSHDPHLAHRRRDPVEPHGSLSRSSGADVVERVRVLPGKRDPEVLVVVQVLDRPRRRCERHGRPEAQHDHRHRTDDARAVGSVHPRRL